jgi:CHAT domain-containing protein
MLRALSMSTALGRLAFVRCATSPEPRTSQPAQRGRRSAVVLSGGTADIEQLKHLAPLPETAIELCLVANSLAPGKGDVYLGNEATEAKIKSLSDSGRLEQYRMLHFATHAALSGQVRGSIEPGLILTPPAAATQGDDGYLTSSEISGLKLNADWVVLSACNTAGSEASNSEAFSAWREHFSMQAHAPSLSRTGRSVRTRLSPSPLAQPVPWRRIPI